MDNSSSLTSDILYEQPLAKLFNTIFVDDPNSNSYVQDIYLPEKDPRLSQEEYERSFEQNEMLGLNDMKTENYT